MSPIDIVGMGATLILGIKVMLDCVIPDIKRPIL